MNSKKGHSADLTPAWLLAFVAGSLDGIGFVALGQLFIAPMSGNTVASASFFGTGAWREGLRRFWPIPVFFLGVLLGSIVVETLLARAAKFALLAPLALEFVLVLLFAMVLRLYSDSHQESVQLLAGALACGAMGIQSAALGRVGNVRVSTTYITGLLTNMAEEIVHYMQRFERIRLKRAGIWCGIWLLYFASAFLGAWLFDRFGFWGAMLPLIALLMTIIVEARSPTRMLSAFSTMD